MGRYNMPAVAFLQLWISILTAGAAAQMPYNPTRLLRNGSRVYVFQPSADSSQFELGSIDVSHKVSASRLPYTNLYPTLPFLDSKQPRPLDAIINDRGNITVYTGDCSQGASGGHIWNFTPDVVDKSGNGSWRQQESTFAQDGKRVADMGPKYLSAGVAFSDTVQSDAISTDAYFFGGMCPFPNANSSGWQSAASYSNFMVTLESSQGSSDAINYQLGVSSSRGPPIPEAGFSLTGLISTVSNRSDGTQIQQQNFVLIGGHTSAAFINTSQVALFSLPQQGWTFVPVAQPDISRKDLAIRPEITSVEPRSGHSAVLTPDGQRMIIFGGWIGDIHTPAEPQLAVLNIGDGYGGSGVWQWQVPKVSGSGLPTGSGIYGHGAVMLPGGVMMVMGGYSLATPSSRVPRASNKNSQTFFFNVTSNLWMSDYSPPPTISTAPPKDGLLSTTSQKAGLGAGLGIGLVALIGFIGFYIRYTRKLKRERDIRERQIQEFSMAAYRFDFGAALPGMSDHEHSNDPHSNSTPPSRNQGWRPSDPRDAERTGLLVDVPSPTRGLRRSLGGRALQEISRYDERRVIHPIDELDEEEEDTENDKSPLNGRQEMTERFANEGPSIFANAPVLDPFTDDHRPAEDQRSPCHSAPASPIREGPSDSNRASSNYKLTNALYLPRRSSPGIDGETSPTKSSERTGSNLSERSTASNLSSRSANGSLGRSSLRHSGAIRNNDLYINPFKTPSTSPTTEMSDQGGSGWQAPANPRTKSSASGRSSGRPTTANADADSFATARSSFMALQAEGEALLGGNPERARPTTASTSDSSNGHSGHDIEGRISRAGTVIATTSLTEGLARAAFGRERRKSLFGSVRRALSRSSTLANRTMSLTTGATQFESYKDDPSSADVSPTTDNRRSFPASAPPRRAASDASFWQSRRGKQDWLEEEADPRWARNSGDDWGTPEDLALAEDERRRREWRERGNLLINLADDDQLPTPRTPIAPGELGVPFAHHDRPSTPVGEEDWDVEAAVERRVVQVMFTVPRSKLRVVNADVDGSSLLSLPRENSSDVSEGSGSPRNGTGTSSNAIGSSINGTGSPGRVKGLAGKFEQLSSPKVPTPRTSPRPSPSPSIKSVKVRNKDSSASLRTN
ncbi:hypothetical protein CC80DRAFT_489284 [Byssothecium circinans]|uniref:Galactose oxidase n=1 Tax=Byssothecium circinans TaxID=147558 RepID=A0A6A5U6U2_9PLEO|nr:hypothetical protein CC80DRAFT_489284 [Byssothecium circinans]